LAAGAPVQTQDAVRERIATLPAFIDATVPELMEQQHVLGTAVVVVHDGRVVFARGYGNARLDSRAPVDPARTGFRIGSVTKAFTAVAALQLAETGRLDLRQDVRTYASDVRLRYGTTTHQLLTHTAGLDERFAGAYASAPEHLEPLSVHLRRFTPPQVFQPGTTSSYSNYNYALAGLIVERLAGRTYDQYIAERILAPLGMRQTTAQQPPPPALGRALARGYKWIDGHHEPIAYTYTRAAPAGGITTTAADMGRFMLALLGDGSVDGERILSPQSIRTMFACQYTPDRRIPCIAYGLSHRASRGERLLTLGGTLGDQASLMVLAPAHKLGFFVASNALPGVGDFLFEPAMTHLFGPSVPVPPPVPIPDALRRAERFAGVYRAYRRAGYEMSAIRGLTPMIQRRVSVDRDGAIRWQGRRWVEVEPLVFRSVDSDDYIVFREDSRGDVSGVAGYERIRWWEHAPVHLGLLLLCLLTFVSYLVLMGVRAVRRPWGMPAGGSVARTCAVFIALTNLAFVAGLAAVFRTLGSTTPLPLPIVAWLCLPLASLVVTTPLPAFAAKAWREGWWNRSERLLYVALTAAALAFMAFLNYWNLLGFRY